MPEVLQLVRAEQGLKSKSGYEVGAFTFCSPAISSGMDLIILLLKIIYSSLLPPVRALVLVPRDLRTP